jgi:hypothetical protein
MLIYYSEDSKYQILLTNSNIYQIDNFQCMCSQSGFLFLHIILVPVDMRMCSFTFITDFNILIYLSLKFLIQILWHNRPSRSELVLQKRNLNDTMIQNLSYEYSELTIHTPLKCTFHDCIFNLHVPTSKNHLEK